LLAEANRKLGALDVFSFHVPDIAPERKDGWQEIHNYIEAMNTSIIKLKTLPLSSRLLRGAHKKPVATAQDVQCELKVSPPKANSILSDFERLGILNEKTGWKRNREFEFTEYLNLFSDN
jgi:Fic family protein